MKRTIPTTTSKQTSVSLADEQQVKEVLAEAPNDIVPWETAPTVTTDVYPAETRSVVMLIAGVPAT